MTQIHCAHTDAGYRCFRTQNGIDRAYFGPAFREPRDAILFVKRLEAVPVTSPLRSPSEASTARPGAPCRAGVRSDASLGVREPAQSAGG